MPKKSKRRNRVAAPDEVWIAPRPAKTSGARTLEPIGTARSNRYLEFADIALGVKETSTRKKKTSGTAKQPERNQNRKSNVASIESHKRSNEGFGAFRNTR